MDETSPLRQATIAAMTARAARDPDAARILAVELDALPYTRRTDSGLFELAEKVGVPADKLAKVALLDARRVPEHATAICPECRDTGSIERSDGRFIRCHVCNPEPVSEDI